ncbi:cell division protein CrgA [Kitasatospora sp. NPDC056327]|uniref:cell division protein CrgA n=1 Tax=Kitasatospora sp. NPDC056327 TaxID=3345785 RepID=UPI0035DB1C18
MPKSRLRKKSDYTPPTTAAVVKISSGRSWVAPLMLAMFLIGLVWIVTYYVTSGTWPVESWRNWNILVGFGFIAAGFGVSTQWK